MEYFKSDTASGALDIVSISSIRNFSPLVLDEEDFALDSEKTDVISQFTFDVLQ